MTAPIETSYSPPPSGGTGPLVRMLQVRTLVAGVPTTVQMEVIAIADSAGNVIDRFMDYNWQRQVVAELAGIRELLARQQGVLFMPTDP